MGVNQRAAMCCRLEEEDVLSVKVIARVIQNIMGQFIVFCLYKRRNFTQLDFRLIQALYCCLFVIVFVNIYNHKNKAIHVREFSLVLCIYIIFQWVHCMKIFIRIRNYDKIM